VSDPVTKAKLPTAPEPANDNAGPSVQMGRMDLADYTRKHILPEAAKACEEGQLRERMIERDGKREVRRRYDVVSATRMSTRWMPGSSVPMLVPVTTYETVPGQLPFGLPVLRSQTVDGFHWQLFLALLKAGTFGRGKDGEKRARKFATSCTFACIGSRG